MTFNPDTDTTPPLDEFLAWLDEDGNNWIRAGIGDYLNALDEAVEQIESLRAKVDRLTPHVITNPADLDATPIGTVLLGADGETYKHMAGPSGHLDTQGHVWAIPGHPGLYVGGPVVPTPATILHTPEEHK